MANHQELQQQIETKLDQECWDAAHIALVDLWSQHATPSKASYVVSRYEQLRPHVPLLSCRLALLRSFTVEPVLPLLRAAAFVHGIDLTVQVSDFNTYAQEILAPTSQLYRFAPAAVILAVQTRDIAPDLWEGYADLSPVEIKFTVERVVQSMRTWIRAFRSHSQAHLIVHTLEVPPFPSQGALDSQAETSQVATVQQINQELRNIASDHAGVYVLDYDALVARYGRTRWYDERKWLTMRMPIAAENLLPLANEWLRFLHPLTGKLCKVVVTDLDNTLWGGIVGEDGRAGLQMGVEYPGAAYRALQRVLLDFYQRGIMLAVCSKNNLEDAMEVLTEHPDMLLRPSHFAALRINWNDKVQNLREIAAELNVGIDTLAFVDDNPVERARVRTALPEVTVIDLPEDPMEYVQAIRQAPVFERLVLSAEDRERGRYYAEQRQRVELEQSASSLEDFYRSLQQDVEIVPLTSETLVRVAQLTQKTNQFNLTTRRYTEQQLTEMAARPDWRVYTVRVKDRFGDSGLVGVAITHDTDAVSEIDTLLLSCRVIGRTVETALLSFLLQQSQVRGRKHLQGWFLPTKKNAPVKAFYPDHKFRISAEQPEGTLWTLDLRDAEITCPDWIRLITPPEVSGS